MNDDHFDLLVKEAVLSEDCSDVWPLLSNEMRPWWTRLGEFAMPLAAGALTLVLLHSLLPATSASPDRAPELSAQMSEMLLPSAGGLAELR